MGETESPKWKRLKMAKGGRTGTGPGKELNFLEENKVTSLSVTREKDERLCILINDFRVEEKKNKRPDLGLTLSIVSIKHQVFAVKNRGMRCTAVALGNREESRLKES